MTDSVLQRMARAMIAKEVELNMPVTSLIGFEPWEDMPEANRQGWIAFARAALAAAIPLPDNIAESLSCHFNNDVTYGSAYQVQFVWSDVIDAILAEEV